jgi:hypothetical protein
MFTLETLREYLILHFGTLMTNELAYYTTLKIKFLFEILAELFVLFRKLVVNGLTYLIILI